jgi:ribosomal protein S27AE
MGLTTFEKQAYCPQCERNVLARYKTFDYFLHFSLSLFSCGLWLPFYVIALVIHQGRDRHLCTRCGSTCEVARDPDQLPRKRRSRDRDDRDD